MEPEYNYDKFSPTARIICAAIKVGDIKFSGPRHYDSVMHSQMRALYGGNVKDSKDWPKSDEIEQGFVDQFGNFYNREEARKHALDVGQEIRRTGGENSIELFSEDLY